MTFLSLVAVGSSLLVVTAPNTVISVLWLVVVFVTTSLLLGLMGLGYAALLYVIVYVGAIAIIFLFVVQLLGSTTNLSRLNNWARLLPLYSSPLGVNSLGQQSKGRGTAKGSATLPIATVIGLSIIYIIVQFSASLTTGSVTANIGRGLNPTSSIYDLVVLWSMPQSTSFITTSVAGHANKATNETFLSNLSYDLVWCGQTSSDLIKPFNISGYNTNQVYNLAEWLYGGATMPLIIASIVLLLAMIAPIVLCRVNETTS